MNIIALEFYIIFNFKKIKNKRKVKLKLYFYHAFFFFLLRYSKGSTEFHLRPYFYLRGIKLHKNYIMFKIEFFYKKIKIKTYVHKS